jgi:hypothetical protein
MRYSLRTLLIVMLLGGPLCAWGWRERVRYHKRASEDASSPFPFQFGSHEIIDLTPERAKGMTLNEILREGAADKQGIDNLHPPEKQ